MLRSAPRALMYALCLPGLGHLYLGDVGRALWIFAAFAGALPASAWIAVRAPAGWLNGSLLLGAIGMLGLYGWSCVDAWRRAIAAPPPPDQTERDLSRLRGEAPPRHPLGALDQPSIYMLLTAIAAVWLIGAALQSLRGGELHQYRTPTGSMAPALLPGDHFWADMRVNSPGGPALSRGDVVVFVHPDDRSQIYVKRLVGLPGDRLELRGGALWRDGAPVAEATAGDPGALLESACGAAWRVARADAADDGVYEVPSGHAFVLGDDRADSRDSRHFGPVPLADVVGRAEEIGLSIDPAGGLRPGRWGQPVAGGCR